MKIIKWIQEWLEEKIKNILENICNNRFSGPLWINIFIFTLLIKPASQISFWLSILFIFGFLSILEKKIKLLTNKSGFVIFVFMIVILRNVLTDSIKEILF